MDASAYVGIPFLDGGRTDRGLDCYGLVRLVLAREFGKDLPEFSSYDRMDAAGTCRMIGEGKAAIPAKKVSEPRDGDVAILRYRGIPSHVGVYIGGCILHTERGSGSVLERADSPRIIGRILEYYRV